MALLTPLPWDAAARLLQNYGLTLGRLEPLVSGSVNSNFFLEADRGRRLFARLYEEQSSAGAEFELGLNEALAQAGIPVARPLRTLAGGLLVEWTSETGRRLPFSVYERVDGEVLCTQMVTPAHTRLLGEALARVHAAPLAGLTLPAGRFGVPGLEQRLETIVKCGRSELERAGRELMDKLVEVVAARDSELSKGLVHGDLFRDNVLFQGERLSALLDFESASLGPYVYDLAVTGLAWCYSSEFRLDCLQALFEGYHSLRPLSSPERQGLIQEARFACVRFATTRITDFSLRVAPGEVPARDYRRFVERLRAIEAGVLDRALDHL